MGRNLSGFRCSGAEGAGAQAFSPRFTVNEPGAIWVTGSTLMTCPAGAPNCAASQAGTASGAALSNNGFAMTMVDADADATTFNSSSSTFSPPAAYEVLFAGLCFGGRVTAGGGGTAAPNAAARGTALLATPAGDYTPVSGAVTDSAAIAGAYVAFADVNALVRVGGAGRYAVANVQSGTGVECSERAADDVAHGAVARYGEHGRARDVDRHDDVAPTTTSKLTLALAPAARVPTSNVPEAADVVPAGSGSATTTPVAASSPVFVVVSV